MTFSESGSDPAIVQFIKILAPDPDCDHLWLYNAAIVPWWVARRMHPSVREALKFFPLITLRSRFVRDINFRYRHETVRNTRETKRYQIRIAENATEIWHEIGFVETETEMKRHKVFHG